MIGALLLAQIAVVAHAPDTASSCAPIEVSVAARAPGLVAPFILLPSSTGAFQLLKSTEVSRIEHDGAGQPSAISEATFVIATDATGRVVLPPFVATVGSMRATAQALPVEVHGGAGQPPAVIVRAWLDRGGYLTPADTLYVGQQVDYVEDVQLNESARQRLRRNPTFFPPEMPGVLAYDLAPPTSLSRAGRRCFETLSYRRALFPLFAGPAAIAPAALTYSLPLSTSFFSREESFELRTDSVRFTAVDVPVMGRPADYSGAVGALVASSRAASKDGRMGDPVVVTLHLEGSGNVKLWPRPQLSLDWASVANGDERVQLDTSVARVRGSKEFDWLLTPRKPGRQQVPALEYPYFNADKREYARARTAPLALDIAAASLASVDSAPVARLAVRRVLREQRPDPVLTQPWFWLLLAMAPAPAGIRRALRRRARRANTQSPSRQLAHAAAKSKGLSPRELRRLFLDAVAERVPAAGGQTQPHGFARALRLGGVTEPTANAAAGMFVRLDEAAFSPSGALDESAVASASTLVRAIDAEALRARPVRSVTTATAILLAFAVSANLLLALPTDVERAFTDGVQAYDHSAFATAASLFSRVASRAPRSEDAWANVGTAAWANNDSAAAVRAWQRALRLDPLDTEMRDRLESVQPASLRSPGYVAPVPIDLLALVGLLCWITAWLVLAVPTARRPTNTRAIAGGALVIAIVALSGALEARDRLDAGGLAVLRTNRQLTEAPGSQTAASTAVTGEIGVVGARDGEWVHIALDGARAGWIPVGDVLLLDAPLQSP